MGLFSFFKRDAAGSAATQKSGKSGARASTADDVQQLRIRARRRLIGAAVLVAAGVIGFPLIFETQPRPIPVDLLIEIPRKESAPPLAVPTREPLLPAEPTSTAQAAAAPAEVVEPARSPTVEAGEPKSEPRPQDKGADKPSEKPAEKVAAPPVERVADKPADKKSAEKLVDKTSDRATERLVDRPKAHANDGARAQALLDGKEPAAPAAARYIVQVGAFAENKSAQEVRNKVEKLGLKTYAQAVDTADGRRVRVRLGPFASRDEAERAAAKLKAAGLAGAILTL